MKLFLFQEKALILRNIYIPSEVNLLVEIEIKYALHYQAKKDK